MLAIIKWLFLLLIGLLLAGFCVVNRHLIVVAFYPLPYELELPTYLLIALLFLTGFASAWIVGKLSGLSKTRQLRQTQKRNDALAEEIARLKHAPILDAPADAHKSS